MAQDDRQDTMIALRGVRQRFGAKLVLDGVDLDVRDGDALAIVGGSGSGKTVLLKTLLGLLPPADGRVEAFGGDLYALSADARRRLFRHWGILFQQDALFSNLTVRENVTRVIAEHFELAPGLLTQLARLKIALAGLEVAAGENYPSELSGGMAKRAGLARALALDPRLLILDEPTTGLDPVAAGDVRDLLRRLHRALRPTLLLVTHDMALVRAICDRVAFIGEGRILADGPLDQVARSAHPTVRAFLGDGQGDAGEG